MQAKEACMGHPDFGSKSVLVKLPANKKKACTGHPAKLLLTFGPELTAHQNYTKAVVAAPYQSYDIFCKIDDDDVYRRDYIESVVSDYNLHQWDYSGAWAESVINGARWLKGLQLYSLGLTESIIRWVSLK